MHNNWIIDNQVVGEHSGQRSSKNKLNPTNSNNKSFGIYSGNLFIKKYFLIISAKNKRFSYSSSSFALLLNYLNNYLTSSKDSKL